VSQEDAACTRSYAFVFDPQRVPFSRRPSRSTLLEPRAFPLLYSLSLSLSLSLDEQVDNLRIMQKLVPSPSIVGSTLACFPNRSKSSPSRLVLDSCALLINASLSLSLSLFAFSPFQFSNSDIAAVILSSLGAPTIRAIDPSIDRASAFRLDLVISSRRCAMIRPTIRIRMN